MTHRARQSPAAVAVAAALLSGAVLLGGAGPRAGAADEPVKGPGSMPSTRRVLITGTSRGLGLEFTRQYLERGDRVFAMLRHPGESKELDALAAKFPERLTQIAGDVTDDPSIEAARAKVASATGALDILINNAGTYPKSGGGLADLDLAEIRSVYDVNAVGPLRVTRAFLALLKKGSGPRVIGITSLMGSIEDNSSGGSWAYRMSKAALNMANRNLAIDLRGDGIACVVLHPGWVRTDMGGPNAPLTPQESVASMIRTIDALTPEKSGGFYDREGQPLPW